MNDVTWKNMLNVGLMALLALMLVACGSGNDEPIKVGMVAGLSGPFTQPEPPPTVEEYFKRINESGGINGRSLELIYVDDQTDPAIASQAARRLVEDEGVVAIVGNASALDCAVNGAYYVEQGIVSIPGTGVDPVCFVNPNISAFNTGPFAATTLMLQYASEELGHDQVCAYFTQLPGTEEPYRAAVAQWEEISGKSIVVQDYSYQPGGEATPLVLNARDAGCQAVLFAGSDAFSIAWMEAVKTQGLLDEIDWLFIGGTYTSNMAQAMGSDANGILVSSEFAPWSETTADLEEWIDIVESQEIQRTAFSLGSYLSAEVFVDTLRGIEGDITRESVTEAFKNLEPYNTPLLGTPYTFGSAETHNSNQAIMVMELQDGEWVRHHDDWYTFK